MMAINSDSIQVRGRRVLVLVLPDVHALDFGGPVQTVAEANGFGAEYRLTYVGTTSKVRTAQGFVIADLESLPTVRPEDWVLVPGMETKTLHKLNVPVDWIRGAVAVGARVSSICSGAFALARAGVLDNRACTTHWKIIERLRREYPAANVLDNRLYVDDGNVTSSAGVASGIDMTLHLVERDYGPLLASQVAREMVVYVRRGGESSQRSVYLEHRAHVHPAVHRVQDYIIEHPDRKPTLEELAAVAAISERHLTRVFREATGITLKEFSNKVKLEVARNLLADRHLSVNDIAAKCGFRDVRQLRRLWHNHFQASMSASRART